MQAEHLDEQQFGHYGCVDLMRRSAGRRRKGRWWDRGLWFCGVALAVLLLSLGLWAQAGRLVGTQVEARVVSCRTGIQLSGRFLGRATACNVSIAQGKFAGTHMVDSAGPQAAGGNIELLAFRGTLSDPRQVTDRILLIPLGVLILGLTWWMGFPPKADLTFGAHAASRKSPWR